MSNQFVLVIFIFTLLGSYGGYCFKKAADQPTIFGILVSPRLYVGGVFYLGSMLLNIYTLKYMPYNIVFPLTSITYIWTLIISRACLNEKITKKKLIGIILLIIGAICMVIEL